MLAKYPQKKTKEDKIRIGLILLFCLYAILQSGLRDISKLPDGNDTPIYQYLYTEASKTSWADLINRLVIYNTDYDGRDSGYPFLMKFTQLFVDDFTFFMFLTAIIFIVPFGMLIYKYVHSKLGIILVFVIYFTLFTNIVNSFMRQAVTLGIMLFSLEYVIRRRWKPYFLAVFVAITIHSSAIAALPFYFMPLLSTSKKWLGLSFAVSPVLIIFLRLIFAIFLTGSVYDNYVQEDAVNPVNYLLLIVSIALLGFLFLNKLREVRDYVILTSAIMGTMLFLPVVFMGNTMLRISYYYVLVLLLTLPNIIDRIKGRTAIYLVLISFFIFMIYWQ